MKFPRHAFREYDIRGVADVDLDDVLVERLGRTFASVVREGVSAERRVRVAVGRDGRLSSERIRAALVSGLTTAGADVIDVGIGPTPLLYFAAHHLDTDGAVMITASHNPAPDNGFKMMRGRASFFGADIQRLADELEGGGRDVRASTPGEVHPRDLGAAYVETIRTAARLPPPERRAVRFVVDGGNGSAGPLGLATLRALGFSPEPLFCDIDGRFPNHHPDPTVPKNLEALVDRVRRTESALGIAWDGDGDRIGVVDATGEIVWGDRLMILLSRALLAERPGATILGEVKCSQTMYAEIERAGGRPIVWKTGHSLIKSKMKEEGALLAGEMSGHIFFADRYFGYDDAIYAAVRVLEIVASTGKTPAELLADVPRTFATPEIRVECADAVKFEVVRSVLDHFRGRRPVLDIDGARIDFGGGAWGLCRASNTGPVLVLRFEAPTAERRDAIRAEVEAVVAKAVRAASADRPEQPV